MTCWATQDVFFISCQSGRLMLQKLVQVEAPILISKKLSANMFEVETFSGFLVYQLVNPWVILVGFLELVRTLGLLFTCGNLDVFCMM